MLTSTATNHTFDNESGLFEELTDEKAQSTSGGSTFTLSPTGNAVTYSSPSFTASDPLGTGKTTNFTTTYTFSSQPASSPAGSLSYTLFTPGSSSVTGFLNFN